MVQDPYALSPDRSAEPDLGDERDLDWIRYDGELGMWAGPFAMAGINARVVRRSNALLVGRVRSAGHTLATEQIAQ